MAINPGNLYPGKTAPPSTDYPFGSARNISTPGDGTGTPWEAALINDLFGFQQALLDGAGATPTGTPERVGQSQYLDALHTTFTPRGEGLATVESVAEGVSALGTGPLIEGQLIRAVSFHPGYAVMAEYNPKGGQYLAYVGAWPKSEHGLTGWSPTVPPLSQQPGATAEERLASFLAGAGETDPTGAGGFVFDVSAPAKAEDFGARGDKLTDDTAPLQYAAATGRTVILGGDSRGYLVSGTIPLAPRQSLLGLGAEIRTTANIGVVSLSEASFVSHVRFTGNKTGADQSGIFIDGGVSLNAVSRTQVIGCKFESLTNGYFVKRIVDNHQGNLISDCQITNCTVGINLEERGEYTGINGCHVDLCGTGVRVIGGNTVISGGAISDCGTGIYIGDGPNPSKLIVSGTAVNHSTNYVIYIDDPTTYVTQFIGCNLIFGDLYINKSNNVRFIGCTFAANPRFFFQGSVDTYFMNCYLNSLPAINNNHLGEPNKTHWLNTTYGAGVSGGTSTPDINGGKLVLKNAATKDITSSSAPQVLPFDTVVANANTNSFNYQFQSFWDPLTNTVVDLKELKSPNSTHYCTVEAAVSIGAATGAVSDFSLIGACLVDADSGRFLAYLTPALTYTSGGEQFKTFIFSGRIPLRDFQVVITNRTGIAIKAYLDSDTNGQIQNRLVVTDF